MRYGVFNENGARSAPYDLVSKRVDHERSDIYQCPIAFLMKMVHEVHPTICNSDRSVGQCRSINYRKERLSGTYPYQETILKR